MRRSNRHADRSGAALLAGLLALTCIASADAQDWQPLGEPGSGGWITSIAISPHDPDRVLLGGDILGVGVSTDGGETWGPSFGFKSWEVGSISFHPTDPNIVWAGTMSGPYRSTDGGVNWTPQRSGMGGVARFSYTVPIEEVLFDPNNSNRLIAVGGNSRPYPSGGLPEWGAIWESLDGGDNWSRVSTITPTGSSPGDNGGVPGVVIMSAAFGGGSSDTLYAAGLNSGFFRSVDGGETWTASNSGLPHADVTRVAAHPTDPSIVYTALDNDGTTPGGIYKSTDGGVNWSLASTNLSLTSGSNPDLTSGYEALRIAPSNPNILYTGDNRFNNSQSVNFTPNGGGIWGKLLDNNDGVKKFDPAGINVETIGVDPNNEDRLFVGTSASVFKSEDRGQSWKDVTSTFVRDGPEGPEFRGAGFTGWVATQIEFNPLDPDHYIIQGLDAARGIQTKNGGDTWVRVMHTERDYEAGRDVAFAGPSVIYGTHGRFSIFDGISRSLDGGVTWDLLHGADRGLPELRAPNSLPKGIYALPSEPNKVWAVIDDQLYHSSDSGDNWSDATAPVMAGDTLRWIAEDLNNPSTFYVSGNGAVYKTIDAGASFESIGGPPDSGKMEVASNGVLFVAAHQGNGNPGNGIWTYDGAAWTQIFDDEFAVDMTIDPLDPQIIAVTTGDDIFHDETAASGVYLTYDGGESWVSWNNNLPMTRGSVITFNPHDPSELHYGTSGRGFFVLDVGTPGDFNGDGRVDTADYSVWRDTLASSTDLRADANRNGVVDPRDFEVWRRNFGRVGSSALASAATPEPTSAVLLLGCLALAGRQRPRREAAPTTLSRGRSVNIRQ